MARYFITYFVVSVFPEMHIIREVEVERRMLSFKPAPLSPLIRIT
jgi:hypothetical protein